MVGWHGEVVDRAGRYQEAILWIVSVEVYNMHDQMGTKLGDRLKGKEGGGGRVVNCPGKERGGSRGR